MTEMDSKPELEKSEVVEEIPMACADETAAVEFIEKLNDGERTTLAIQKANGKRLFYKEPIAP